MQLLRALAATTVFAGALLAQSNGAINGTIKDSKGGVIAGAVVTVSNPDQAVRTTATTNAEGGFVFPLLPPGTYTVTAEMAGFKKAEKSGVVVPVATKVSMGDIILDVGS